MQIDRLVDGQCHVSLLTISVSRQVSFQFSSPRLGGEGGGKARPPLNLHTPSPGGRQEEEGEEDRVLVEEMGVNLQTSVDYSNRLTVTNPLHPTHVCCMCATVCVCVTSCWYVGCRMAGDISRTWRMSELTFKPC